MAQILDSVSLKLFDTGLYLKDFGDTTWIVVGHIRTKVLLMYPYLTHSYTYMLWFGSFQILSSNILVSLHSAYTES